MRTVEPGMASANFHKRALARRHDSSRAPRFFDPANPFKTPFEPGGRTCTGALFQTRLNCDSVRHADRFSSVIGGLDYFLVRSRGNYARPVQWFIVRRDLDSRMRPAFEASDDACADALCILFHDVAANRKRLRIYIHVWDTRCCVRYSASGCRSENGTADPLCSAAAP